MVWPDSSARTAASGNETTLDPTSIINLELVIALQRLCQLTYKTR